MLNYQNIISKELNCITLLSEKMRYDINYNDPIIQTIIAILYQQYNTEFFMSISIPKISKYIELFSLPIFNSLINICEKVEILCDQNTISGLKAKGLKEIAVNNYLNLKKENELDFCIRDLLKPYNELPSINNNELQIFEYKKNNDVDNVHIYTDFLLNNKFFLFLAIESIRNSGSYAMPLIGLTSNEIETSIYFEQMTHIWDRVCILGSGKDWVSTHLFLSGFNNNIELSFSE